MGYATPGRDPNVPIRREVDDSGNVKKVDSNSTFKVPSLLQNYPPPPGGKITPSYIKNLAKTLDTTYYDWKGVSKGRYKNMSSKEGYKKFEEDQRALNEHFRIIAAYETKNKWKSHGNVGDTIDGYGTRTFNEDKSLYSWKATTPKVDYGKIRNEFQEARSRRGSVYWGNEKIDFSYSKNENMSDSEFRNVINKKYKYMIDRNKQRSQLAKDKDLNDLAAILAIQINAKSEHEKLGARTWGPNYKDVDAYKEWTQRTSDRLGPGVGNTLTTISGQELKDLPLPSDIYDVPGKKSSKLGGLDDIANFLEMVVDTAAGAVYDVYTAPVKPIVKAVEMVDDVVDDGKNPIAAGAELIADTTGTDNLVDSAKDLAEGDVVGAGMEAYEYYADQENKAETGSFIDSNVTGDPGGQLKEEIVANLEEETEQGKDNPVANLREDIKEDVEDLMYGEEEEDSSKGDINVSPIEKTTMKELKALLGLAEDAADGDVIKELVGAEARKLSDNQDIVSVLSQQRQIAEQGYDIGEREALSAKSRRELAGLARQQGQAAGAAAGGMRGASVGAQARSLAEQAMQKQADVTTEMDKASISRKDQARKDLANLAKDTTKFDIEKEEARKKRKGATTVGVSSLLSQEELGKIQLELAGYDTKGN